jgi:hypothetical protein
MHVKPKILNLLHSTRDKVYAWRYILEQKNGSSIASTNRVIALMMEIVSTSETLVNFYQTTWHYNSEDSRFHTCSHENMKSHRQILSKETNISACLNTNIVYFSITTEHTWL